MNFATGLAPSLIAPLEINRAQAELQSLRQTQQVAIRDWRVASARLAEVLLLDPATLLEPIEPPFLQVTFVPAERSPDELMPIALNSRPEIASRRELVAAAEQLLRQEKTRPLLPNLFVISPSTTTGLLAAGNFSAGANELLSTNGSRLDIEVAAVWQLQNAGVGNIGRIRQRRAEQGVASIELTRTVFRVKSEIAQAVPGCTPPASAWSRRRRAAPGDRVGRQELHRPARDDAARRGAAPPDRPSPGSRRRHRSR